MDDENPTVVLLSRIANALERMVAIQSGESAKDFSPNYQRTLAEFPTFDWSSIDAEVLARDADGPTNVRWGGYIWTRRSPTNKYKPAIWFSRSIGKNENDENQYISLISFRTIAEADPVDNKVRKALEAAPKAAETVTPATKAEYWEYVSQHRNWNGEQAKTFAAKYHDDYGQALAAARNGQR